jgi:hypothetical protein
LEILAILFSAIIIRGAGFSVGFVGAFTLFMLAFTAGVNMWGSFYVGSPGLGYLGFRPALEVLDWRPFFVAMTTTDYSQFALDFFSVLASTPAIYGQILSWGCIGYAAGYIYNFGGKRDFTRCVAGSLVGTISFVIIQTIWTGSAFLLEVFLATLVSLVVSLVFIDFLKSLELRKHEKIKPKNRRSSETTGKKSRGSTKQTVLELREQTPPSEGN